MTTVSYVNESPGNKGARKTSLEAGGPKPGGMEASSLRRVRSDSLTPSVHTFTPDLLKDNKSSSPKTKVKFDLFDSTQLLGGDLAKGKLKKHPGKQRQRRSSVQKGIMLDVVSLHRLKSRDDEEDRKMIYKSEQSLRTSPSPEQNENTDKSRLSPSLTVTCSTDDDGENFENESDTSSIYHSSCMYQPEDGPKTMDSLGVDPKKHYKRRMSSPIVNFTRQQTLDGASSRMRKVAEFPEGERRHSSQDVPNLVSIEPATLPSKVRYYSTHEDLTAITPQGKDGLGTPARERQAPSAVSVTPNKEFRGSTESQAQQLAKQKHKDSAKNVPDQNCRSYFGIMLSGICFVLFLWYLGMVSSKFIKSALSFDAFSDMDLPELGPVQEVVVYIAVDEVLEVEG